MNKIAILTTSFNHLSSPYFTYNWQKFCHFISKCKLNNDLYICEIIPKNTKPIALLDNSNHYTIINNSILWHKESALNYLLTKLPDKYDFILIIDNDIFFDDYKWYNKLTELLQDNIAVQPFDQVEYMQSNNTDIDYIDTSIVRNSIINNVLDRGNPGIAIAYNRNYLENCFGLFDRCIVGGGDLINIVPFFYETHNISFRIFDTVCKDSVSEMLEWFKKSYHFIQNSQLKPISYIEKNVAKHLFHGYRKHRQYQSRYSIINNERLDHITKKDSLGFYHLIDENIETKMNLFFDYRRSISVQNQPQIVSRSKYIVDHTDLLWLSSKDILYFYNITKVSITFNRCHNLKNLQIVCDDVQLNIDDLLDEAKIQTITIENPRIMNISCENLTHIKDDIRDLGLFVTKISIVKDGSFETQEYPLSNVL